MKIKKLNISSYGQLIDKDLTFKKGLNVVIGPNESGKSTIRSFIFNLFFGGTLPGSTRAVYTKDYDRYVPWNSNRYEGSALVEDGGKTYHIYRNFNKGFEKFSVFDAETGSDSKDHFNIDTSRKVQAFDENYFGINESSLRDIFEITDDHQMKNRLSYDLKDRIVNHFSSQSEDISIGQVIENIETKAYTKEDKKELKYLTRSLEDINRQISLSYDSTDTDEILLKSMDLDREINKLKEDLEILEEDLDQSLRQRPDKENRAEERRLLLEKINTEDEIKDLEDSLSSKSFLQIINFSFILPALIFFIYFFKAKSLQLLITGLALTLILGLLRIFYGYFKSKSQEKTKAKLRILYNDLDGLIEALKIQEGSNLNIEEDSLALIEKINKLKDQINDKAIQREVFYSQVKERDKDLENLRLLEQEKEDILDKIADLNFKSQMKDTAIEIISKLSKVKFETVSTNLIEDCSDFIKIITNNKYSKLLINDDLDLLLFDNSLQKFVYIEDLSKATIGQVYLAYRLGLIVNSGVDFPIIIDDGFSLYDMDRNEASLKLLEKLSEDYQIILFTSNTRDLILDPANINIIKLWS